METTSKIEGYRKMGIAGAGLAALTMKDAIEFKTGVMVCIIAGIGIIAQALLDAYKIKKGASYGKKTTETA